MTYYLNEDKTYRPCDVAEWGEQFEKIDRTVANDDIKGCHVSTVFIGINHNFCGGDPIVFETMIFNSKGEDIYCLRYSTWDQAIIGHNKAIQWVLDRCYKENNELD